MYTINDNVLLKKRKSTFELLRIICMITIMCDHFVGNAGVAAFDSFSHAMFSYAMPSFSRISCSIFAIIGAYFLVDLEFDIKRIIHIWITVFFYAVPITLWFYVFHDLDKTLLYRSLFPINEAPLMYPSTYILLLLLAPILNSAINTINRYSLRNLLILYGIIFSGYATLTAHLGILGSEIWTLLYCYLITGYLKKYRVLVFNNIKVCLIIGLLFPLVRMIVIAFFYCEPDGQIKTIAYQYLEFYRCRIIAFPNIMSAFGLFFLFKHLNIRYNRVINTIASATFGVFVIHCVPCFSSYFWMEICGCAKYSGTGDLWFSIKTVLSAFMLLSIIELIRLKVVAQLIENREWYKKTTNKMNKLINGA